MEEVVARSQNDGKLSSQASFDAVLLTTLGDDKLVSLLALNTVSLDILGALTGSGDQPDRTRHDYVISNRNETGHGSCLVMSRC